MLVVSDVLRALQITMLRVRKIWIHHWVDHLIRLIVVVLGIRLIIRRILRLYENDACGVVLVGHASMRHFAKVIAEDRWRQWAPLC